MAMRAQSLILAALAFAAAGQQPVFRATSNLVVVDVFVRDRSGKDVPGLHKEDFALLEDGKPQAVAVFEYQRLGAAAPMAPAAPAARPAKTAPARPQAITTVAPGKVQYQDRRLIVLFFDLSSMQPAEQVRARKAARKFLQEQMTANDLVAVMTFSTELKVVQDFSADRDQLETALRSFMTGEGSDLAVVADTGDDTSGEDTGAAFVADESEFNIFNTDRKLSALESAARMLSGLPEKKALVYFSSGVSKTGVENQSQLRSTVNEAVRANVSFYPVDARGLVAMVPGGDASHATSRGAGMFSGTTQTSQRTQFNDQQETLVSLAADTGGKALLDNNDLAMGIRQAQQDIRSYYILGYYSTNQALDGRYRRIQVKLAPRLEAKLDYRGGYFAPKEFGKFTETDKERQLEQALMLGDPVTDLPLALEVNHFRLGRDRYFVPAAVKIPGSEVVLARKGANQVTEFDFIGQVRDDKGRMVASVRDGIRVKLDEEGMARLARRNFEYDTGFTLPPGTYSLKFLARENQTGKMGTFETRFTVPDLNAKSDYLRLSSVVWANQREPLAAAIGTAGQQQKVLALNPLVDEGQKLVPSITRVFRKDQNLYVYLEAYDPVVHPPENKPSLVAALSFYRGKVKAFETPPVRLSDLAPKRASTLQVKFQVPLDKFEPGRYTCQVTVVDELGKKFAFSRGLLAVLP
jgi:VWFA-related protein